MVTVIISNPCTWEGSVSDVAVSSTSHERTKSIRQQPRRIFILFPIAFRSGYQRAPFCTLLI